MNNQRTSWVWLNADERLTKAQRAAYILFNWANNLFPTNGLDANLVQRPFAPSNWRELWPKLNRKTSPSRRLSDLFWSTLPWAELEAELGPLRVVDTGCGDGRYGEYLQEFSGGRIASYAGLDPQAHPSWQPLMAKHSNFVFTKATASTLAQNISDDANLFITQSALEHIDGDLDYFRTLRSYIDARRRPVVQIHLLPSAACLKLYLWHGIRQYTPRTLSKVARLFGENSYVRLYGLGGEACNRVYWEYVTLPKRLRRIGDLRETRTEEYENRLLDAVSRDFDAARIRPSARPNFYALVIHSNWTRCIFD